MNQLKKQKMLLKKWLKMDKKTLHAPILLSIFISDEELLGKKYWLDAEDNVLIKKTVATLSSGNVEVIALNNFEALCSVLNSMTANTALSYGIPEGSKAGDTFVVKSQKNLPSHPGAIARDNEHFEFSGTPGILMLDCDDEDNLPKDMNELRSLIVKACPELSSAPMIHCTSSSSNIENKLTNEVYSGTRGQRFYIFVKNTKDIPRIGDLLFKKLVLLGYGKIKFSSSGQMLLRTIIDGAVFQPERLDFGAMALCISPITQKPITYTKWNINQPPLNTYLVKDLSISERNTYDKIVSDLKKIAAPQQEVIQELYIATKASSLMSSQNIDLETAKVTIKNALRNQDLGPDFLLYPQHGNPVSVREILTSPQIWHGKRFSDPLEPDYQNDDRIAICSVNSSGVVRIHSHARGLHAFTLTPNQTTIIIANGFLENAVEESLEVMRKVGQVFDFGDKSMARISKEKIYSISTKDSAYLCSHLERHANYRKQAQTNVLVPCNIPSALVNRILALNGERNLPILNGVITAPTMTIHGEIIDTPGYHEGSGLYLHINSSQYKKIPKTLSDKDILHATEKLLEPFKEFCFDSAISRSVLLAALLTAAVRASVSTRPAFAFDAPSAGSGKTLLANCISVMSGGTGSTLPAVDDDAELRKIFISELKDGSGDIVLDNVVGILEGSAINHFVTAESFKGRILGVSETVTVPNHAMLILTGNNIRIHKDLIRRVLVCRLDTGEERPYTREFSFCPMGYIKANRLKMIEYALTIISGTFQAKQNIKPPLGSFNEWDRLVRQPILKVCEIIDSNKIAHLELGDPIDAIINGTSYDPETATIELLLKGLHHRFGAEYKTPREIFDLYSRRYSLNIQNDALFDALEIINDDMSGNLTARKLGVWLLNRKDRISNNMKLVSKKDNRTSGYLWRCNLVGAAGKAASFLSKNIDIEKNIIKKAHALPAAPAEQL